MSRNDIVESLVGRDFGFGPLSREDAEHHAAWHAASGHRGGWRCVRGLSPLEELLGAGGQRILFRSLAAAQKRCDALNREGKL